MTTLKRFNPTGNLSHFAALLYVLALILPAIERTDGEYFFGWQALLLGLPHVFFASINLVSYTSAEDLLWLAPLLLPWFANLYLPLHFTQILHIKFKLKYNLSLAALLIVALFFIKPVVFDEDSLTFYSTATPLIGAYCWGLAFLCLFLANRSKRTHSNEH
ncbi:hypothetical protein [uncultured Shewanella sp.]|uniref:hypothetical protein n=1 Tax=uncultured Shewanella sp. TaxID=173975 RepID=UPI002614BD35|nr:hypothetical protein [uncultured Shewanella sp.]